VVALAAEGRLVVQGSDESLAFSVERKIRMTPSPLSHDNPAMRGVQYVGIESDHELTLQEETRAGEIDLWQLLQTPVGSVVILPLRAGHRATPLSYGLPGEWQLTSDSLIWRITGNTNAKIGIAAQALTGRAGILRWLPSEQWCLIVRQFPVDESARYGDYPAGTPRDDQVFQAWDGLGFGEIEFHSPVLDGARGPRNLRQKDHLWAFGGSAQRIATLASVLLQVDIEALLREAQPSHRTT
jgi:hypothetical protein